MSPASTRELPGPLGSFLMVVRILSILPEFENKPEGPKGRSKIRPPAPAPSRGWVGGLSRMSGRPPRYAIRTEC
jgi:hypothetical protein